MTTKLGAFVTVFLCVVLFSQTGLAQKKQVKLESNLLTQPRRIEFASFPNTDFQVIEGGDNGLAVIERTNSFSKEGKEWRIHLLDTLLNIVSSTIFYLRPDASLVGYENTQKRYYLIFTKSQFNQVDFDLFWIDVDNQQLHKNEITTVFPVQLEHFEAIGKNLLLSGSTNDRPVLISYNTKDTKPQVVPGFYDNNIRLQDVSANDETGLFTVVLSEKIGRSRHSTLRVKTLTAQLDLLQDNLVTPAEHRNLLDASSTSFLGGVQYVAGTQSKKSSIYSQGFYLSKFINGKQMLSKYYPFSELSNFFGYLKPRREQRIKERIANKKSKGKVKQFNYRLLIHDIIKEDNHFVMIGEAYFPRYDYSNSSGIGSYSRFNKSFDPYFLGYKYTHAAVVAFDANCEVIWNHTFKIEDILTYTLKKNVVVCSNNGTIALVYVVDNEIRTKLVNGDNIVEDKTFNPIRLNNESDKLQNPAEDIEGIKKWYGNTLFVYGIQQIKNSSIAGDVQNRKVFYINKITFNPS